MGGLEGSSVAGSETEAVQVLCRKVVGKARASLDITGESRHAHQPAKPERTAPHVISLAERNQAISLPVFLLN